MIKQNKFKKYTDGKIEYLCIDSMLVDDTFKTDVYNNTNYENVYYVKENIDGFFEFIKREEMTIDVRYLLFITKEKQPIEFEDGRNYKYIRLKECGKSTIKDFLELDYVPRINIGDVNPEEHGAILIEESSDGIEYFVQKIDKIPDEKPGYVYLESVVPSEKLNGDYSNILDIELSEFATDCYGSNIFDGHLFFNQI